MGVWVNRRLPNFDPAPSSLFPEFPDLRIHLLEGEAFHFPSNHSAWKPLTPTGFLAEAWTTEGRYLQLRFRNAEQEVVHVFGPGGRDLWITWNERAALEDIVTSLQGTILGCVLRLQGKTFLHGSAVGFGGRAVGFLGPKGAGKSTTALALTRRGATMVTDDLLIIEEGEAGIMVQPGPPSFRLRPDPADALCGVEENVRPLWLNVPRSERKFRLDVPQSDRITAALPLEALYVLGGRGKDCQRCEALPMPPADALGMLMAQRSGTFLLDQAAHQRDLARFARLIQRVPVRHLIRPDGLDSLNQIIDTVLPKAGSGPAVPN